MRRKLLLSLFMVFLCSGAQAQTSSQMLIDTINTFTVVRDLKVHKDLAYGEHGRQKLDLYLPKQKGTHPVLIFVHGGTWQKYKKDDFKFIGESFARAGYVTAIINYRLYPEVQYPAFVQDTVKAFRWIKDHVAAYSGDPNRIFVMGHSAGGYNAVMSIVGSDFLAAEGLKASDFKGVIGIAGLYDIPPLDGIFAENVIRREVMPVYRVNGPLPAFLLLSAGNDDLVMPENALKLAKALQGNGTPVETFTVPNLGHTDILATLVRRISGNFPVRDMILKFMQKQL
ncbi:alpha/beta hydrolase [Deinococcus cellulosilyticus]|uniref:Uncharacterized protein n=1 Tax=Deinococcus cellulosilyticus (strain DSM 18568 / NBRC 106333 / KACC 11606 / 5516J-15) TaxID=1223518 RepID=A0A511N236_DEIC1|nr:alpha/beta hydrolase [Deinococcus cellulosilyticus]GEM46481.1 hypothetical protein DC3_21160 [Deinococcus cellulosilyticus NBRC 106333 = KACC 11606]